MLPSIGTYTHACLFEYALRYALCELSSVLLQTGACSWRGDEHVAVDGQSGVHAGDPCAEQAHVSEEWSWTRVVAQVVTKLVGDRPSHGILRVLAQPGDRRRHARPVNGGRREDRARCVRHVEHALPLVVETAEQRLEPMALARQPTQLVRERAQRVEVGGRAHDALLHDLAEQLLPRARVRRARLG